MADTSALMVHESSELLLRVRLHLERNLAREVGLEEIAEIAGLSRFHAHRILSGMLGEPVAAHLRRLKMQHAALRLRSGTESILNIALDVGYDDHAAFTRAFRRHFAVTPQAWRAGKGLPPRPPSLIPLPDVRICDLVPGLAVFARHVGPYAGVGAAWKQLLSWAGPRGLIGPGTPLIGIGHDDPSITAAEHIRYDACVPVAAGIAPGPGLGLRPLPGGLHAVAIHVGPLAGLDATYSAIAGRWLPEHGWRLRDEPCSDLHLDDPRTTPADRLRTEVRLPIARTP